MMTIERLKKNEDEAPVIVIRPVADSQASYLRVIRTGRVVDLRDLAQQRTLRQSLGSAGRSLARSLLGNPSTSA
jgi:hypothetical protein